MDSTDKRLFIGIEVGEDIVALTREAAGLLERHGQGYRWVPPENVHLTLRFLGNCPAELVEPIFAALVSACSQRRPFSIQTTGFGAFPGARRARVLWLGLTDTPDMQGLYREISEELERVGFPAEERSFRPHVTFARLKKPAPVDLTPTERVPVGLNVLIDKVTLFSSTLTRTGAKYEVVGRAVLGQKTT